MAFEDYGMKNGIVTIPGFGMDVSIGDKNYIRVDGLVQNIKDHTRTVSREFGLQENFGDVSTLSGRTITVRYEDYAGSVIFHKDMGEAHNIFTLGHESFEMLMEYGMEETLVDLFRDAGFAVSGNISNIPRELFCDVGGLLALHLKGKREEFVAQYPNRIHPGIVDLMYRSLQR